MDLLNEQSFAQMLTHCYENEEYQGVVMLDNEGQKADFIEELLRNHNESPITGVRRIISRPPHNYIEFENDSEIEIITPRDLHRMRGHRFNEALLDADVLDFDAIDALGRLVTEYNEAIAQERIRRRRRRTFADMVMGRGYTDESTNGFDTYAMGKWGASENSDVEIKVDKKSKEVVDDFLDSFKIHNSLEFGS